MKIIATLDCGCVIKEDGSQVWCPTCSNPPDIIPSLGYFDLKKRLESEQVSVVLKLVRFSPERGKESKMYAISEETVDRWCECEPREGYGEFKELGDIYVDVGAMVSQLAADGFVEFQSQWGAK